MRPTPSRPIERIEPDPRHEDAVRLIVDGRTVLTIPREAAVAEHLAPGLLLSEAAFQRLCGWADREAAYRTAIRLLTRRPFARRDLGRRLMLKGHQPEAVSSAVERAEATGALDDERFARHYVQTRTARGRGPARIRRELLLQGVGGSIIERVLADEIAEDGTKATVIALVRKRAHQLRDLDRPARVKRVLAFLARRGYTGAEVRRVVRETA